MSILTNCWAGNFRAAQNEHVVIGAASAFNLVPTYNTFSIHAWMKTGEGDTGAKMLAAKGFKTDQQYGVGTSGTDIYVYVGGSTYVYDVDAEVGVTLNNGEWHQVVVTFSTNQLKVYVDNNLVSTQGFSSSDTYTADLVIGGVRSSSNSDITRTWNGHIDEVGIWNTILTPTEVTSLYNGGSGLMLGDDSGGYVSSDSLLGWWRMGDGATEHAGTVPTAIVSDESGNGFNGTVESDSLDLASFYYGGGGANTVPGQSYCELFYSSSSYATATGATFTVIRKDQSNIQARVGFDGKTHRMILTCEGSPGVDTKIFVHELGRPAPGTYIRSRIFRRIASLQDLIDVPVDEYKPVFPFRWRTDRAEIVASNETALEQAWQIVQKQCRILSLDLQEFGVPVVKDGKVKYYGGAGEATVADVEVFGAVTTASEESSSAVAGDTQASSAVAGEPYSSSSTAEGTSTSSSEASLGDRSSSTSTYVDPYLFSNQIFRLASESDAVMRFDKNGSKTLYEDLGFIRFGRNINDTDTWDSFIVMNVTIPKCAEIVRARLLLSPHTTEVGEDVVIRVRDFYADSSYTSPSVPSSTSDPTKARAGIAWSAITPVTTLATTLSVDVTEMLQFFVDRESHNGAGDSFGLWLQEVVSDPGARRDATVSASGSPSLLVTYRTDRECSSSAVEGVGGVPGMGGL